MLKSIMLKTAIASLLLGSLSTFATTEIDLFDDTQANISAINTTVSSFATGAGIIGGERDITVTASEKVRANSGVEFGELLIGSSAASLPSNFDSLSAAAKAAELALRTFTVEVQWDGLDNDAALNTTPGILPAANFAGLEGFSATVNQSDGDGFFEVDVWSLGLKTSVLLPFAPVVDGHPQTFSIPFAFFMPTIDLSSVSAIALRVTATGNTDINVDTITAVPAPSSLAVLGLGLLGFAGFARRRKA